MSTYSLPNGAVSHNVDAWQSSGRSRFHHSGDTTEETISERVTNIFTGPSKDALPMYKDKPAHYRRPGGRSRIPPWARRKRVAAPVLIVLAVLSWYFGILSPLSWFSAPENNLSRKERLEASKDAKGKPGWFGSGKDVVDWPSRAEKVKDVFKITYSGYEKYGWGRCRVCAHWG